MINIRYDFETRGLVVRSDEPGFYTVLNAAHQARKIALRKMGRTEGRGAGRIDTMHAYRFSLGIPGADYSADSWYPAWERDLAHAYNGGIACTYGLKRIWPVAGFDRSKNGIFISYCWYRAALDRYYTNENLKKVIQWVKRKTK